MMREGFVNALTTLASRDDDLILLTADLGFGVFEEFGERFPNQFYNVGVAEQSMVGVASGLAKEGCRVFCYSIANFSTMRCLEQIRNDAAYHEYNVNVVSNGAGFSYGQLGMSHHATEDLGVMRLLPGVSVYAPCNSEQAFEVTKYCYTSPGVSYIRLDKTEAVDDRLMGGDLHQIREIKAGRNIAVLTIGGLLGEAIKAVEEVCKQYPGVVGLFCAASLKPFDEAGLAAIASKYDSLVIIEEHMRSGGLFGRVAELCLVNGLSFARVEALGIDDCFVSCVGDQAYLRAICKLDASSIENSIVTMIRESAI